MLFAVLNKSIIVRLSNILPKSQPNIFITKINKPDMSTASNNFDSFEESIFDPLVQFENKSVSNDSLQWGPCGGGKYNSEQGENEMEGERWRDKGVQEGDSEKRETTPESFTTSLWSDHESLKERTLTSWDLPLYPTPWDDNDKPMERLLSYADLTLTDAEENGLLTDRIVAACSSYLTESPGNKCHIVAKVLLNNKNLNDIRILGYHRFLQYVDLSWNNLTDLTPLGCLPYLMYLDVSHNLMEEVLRFRPPLNLTYVNYSYNEVWQIDDLTDFWALSYLDLSHNKISKIQGLHELRYLRHLDLSHNKIERFENLNFLKITDLNLEYNLISRFEKEQDLGMKTLPHLSNVYLNNNLITSLEFLKGVYSLKKLELQGNSISDMLELSYLKSLKNLRHLDLSGNPVSELKPYRSLILNFLQDLKFLDQTEVDIAERVAACKKKRFDVQLEAARNHARMVLLEQLNNTSLDLDVLPVDQGPYPFVILVGPSGSSKKHIVCLLGEKYPERIYIGRLHTTRYVLESEKNILVHMNKEDFDESIKEGKFLCVTENLGQLYGFSREELGNAIKEKKLCLTAMDMVAALTIHSYGIQPFLVLTLPQSREEHTENLKKIYGPVLSTIGAAYIAQRQLVDTHTSNVGRIAVILGEILDNVMQYVCGLVPMYGESPGFSDVEYLKPFTDNSSQSLSSSNQEKQDLTSETELPPESPCYRTEKGCFACTPSKCGYQTAKMQESDAEGVERQKSSEDDSNSQKTSFSAKEPSKKVHVSVSEDNSGDNGNTGEGGEDDPFFNWSMPFIDWSEVNLTSMALEEAAELLCEKYIENVMSSKEVYQNLHLENPGLFALSIYTDDVNKAVKDITKLLKEVWRSTPKRDPVFDVENDLVYQAFVPRKIEKLKEMLRNDFLSADGDGAFKGLTTAAPLNSPRSICVDMHMKGYGDYVENL